MLHYEIHVTVRTKHLDMFKAKCSSMGVKPIIIDLQKDPGDDLYEVMTSSTLAVEDITTFEAKKQMRKIADDFVGPEFEVVRCKIETVPWHPAAPSNNNDSQHFPGSHFETHFSVIVEPCSNVAKLKEIANHFNLHFSKNILKTFVDGSYIQMVTYRSYDKKREEFETLVDQIESEILSNGFNLRKQPKIEFAIFDTNITHDFNWLN